MMISGEVITLIIAIILAVLSVGAWFVSYGRLNQKVEQQGQKIDGIVESLKEAGLARGKNSESHDRKDQDTAKEMRDLRKEITDTCKELTAQANKIEKSVIKLATKMGIDIDIE